MDCFIESVIYVSLCSLSIISEVQVLGDVGDRTQMRFDHNPTSLLLYLCLPRNNWIMNLMGLKPLYS